VAVSDDKSELASELGRAFGEADVVVVAGGLGPTADDVTRECVAEAAGVGLVLDQEVIDKLKRRFAGRGAHMPAANRRQALFPEGSVRLENPIGTADGWSMKAGKASVFVLPGVPGEMEAMLPQVVNQLRESGSAAGVESKLRIFGLSEAAVDEKLSKLINADGNPEVGLLAEEGIISVRILARGKDEKEARRLTGEMEGEVRRRLGEHIFGVDDEGLQDAVARELERTGKKLAAAESCTGGLICDMLTDVPGISRHFLEGVVCYSDAAKRELLGVPAELIREHGAVSEEVAVAMAKGVMKRAGSDVGVSVTGIAGPGGGNAEKPVGLCYIGLSGEKATECRRYNFGQGRRRVKDRAAKTALYLVWKRLKGS